jgi:hypothetical protein
MAEAWHHPRVRALKALIRLLAFGQVVGGVVVLCMSMSSLLGSYHAFGAAAGVSQIFTGKVSYAGSSQFEELMHMCCMMGSAWGREALPYSLLTLVFPYPVRTEDRITFISCFHSYFMHEMMLMCILFRCYWCHESK